MKKLSTRGAEIWIKHLIHGLKYVWRGLTLSDETKVSNSNE